MTVSANCPFISCGSFVRSKAPLKSYGVRRRESDEGVENFGNIIGIVDPAVVGSDQL